MAIPQVAVSPSSTNEYRKLVGTLARRAAKMGSRDPESAAHEAMKRSLISSASREAVEYYFSERPARPAPEWSLLRLLAWLHGVVQFVVREERARARFHRERSASGEAVLDVTDTAPDPLTRAIDAELRGVAQECLAKLSSEYRSALQLRLDGAKYADIAARLGVNENTVATWLRRGALEFVRLANERVNPQEPHGSHGPTGDLPASDSVLAQTVRHA